jgi:ADP-dependent NAD(P)H-hydrate dehydratase / NAD(P)H-hydrate epimerase
MKILNAEQIRIADAYTIEHEPVASIDLMERAAKNCYDWINKNFGNDHGFKIFVGPGNNGGDGLAIARMLADNNNEVEIYMLTDPGRLSPDALTNYNKAVQQDKAILSILDENTNLPAISSGEIMIDAMFGSGLTRPLVGLPAKVVKHVNLSGATVIAIDIPSGLYCDINTYDNPETIIQADFTLTFQLPKLAFLFSENEIFTGAWHILDISIMPKAIDKQDTTSFYIEQADVAPNLHSRKKFAHKGAFGHALLLAGSYGKMGAAVLASKACLKTGVGLLTTHIITKGYNVMQTSVPEAMASIDPGSDYLSSLPDLSAYNAIGVGPGIGTNDFTGFMFHQLLKTIDVPMVLDADALNLLSAHPEWIEILPENTILTPHPGEFDRLKGGSKNGYERYHKQINFSIIHKVIVVLKGAYTSISTPDGICWFNSTGNPGMATAGSGDALTGIILSLLAQGYDPQMAAITGVYLHGLAGDLACAETGEEALLASDIINHIGQAFIAIRSKK